MKRAVVMVKNVMDGCKCGGEGKDKFLEDLCNEYKPIKDNLIQMLNEVQEHYGYVPTHAQKVLWID